MKRALASAALAFALGGCSTVQNALGGQGAEGANFVLLFTVFLVICAVMYVVVLGGLSGALWRRRPVVVDYTVEGGRHSDEPRTARRLLTAWAIAMVVGLAGLTIASFFTDRSNALATAHPQLRIEVTGNQWWWDVEYKGRTPGESFHTANELYLPVGVPVEVKLKSNDVIHSFWVPNLAGKQDLIPGRESDIQLLPRKVGKYRGQCAEFCGIQHANMALDVTVTDAADFANWMKAQQRVAFAPTTPQEMAGYQLATSRQCASCHAVAGTPANGAIGPDLTHVASRNSIAAGTLPMTAGNMARWIADPQAVKPGTNMPKVELSRAQLAAVTAYMRRLQ